MKVLVFEYDKMVRAGQLLNSLSISGADNFVALGELVKIINSGKVGDYEEKEMEGGGTDGMECKEICKD